MNQVAVLPTPFDYLLSSPDGWDFDHDGKREFVASKKFDMSSVTFLFYESVGDNSFALVHQLQFSGQWPGASYLASDVGDADGDGLPEMTIHGKAGGSYRVRLLESPSVGAYPSQTVWALPTASFEREVKIADTDGDGKKELVISGQGVTENRIEIHENTGDNAFRQTFYHGFPHDLLNSAQSMTIADDLDGDGRVEILMGGIGSTPPSSALASRVVALESTGNDSYEESWSVELPYSEGQLVNATALIDAGDLDGDGKKEFVVGGATTISSSGSQFYSVLYVYEAVADNTLSVVAYLRRFMGCICTGRAALADIDGDGKREIVLDAESGWSIYRNTGDNTWEEVWSAPPPGSDITSIAAGDLDGDGKDEVIVPQSWIYEVDPADAADLDGDGRVDAIDNCPAVANPSQEDADLDAVGDSCDNCVHGPNPDQGPAPFGQTVLAEDRNTFSWTIPADIVQVRGDLSAVSRYAVDVVDSAALAMSWTDPSVPAVGGGFYYLVRPDCPVGSWQSSLGAEPGRDAALP